MKLDRAGYPFIAGALAPAAYCLLKKKPGLGVPLLGLAGFLAYFFRDPERYPPQHPDLVLSPADGRVMVAGPGEPGVAPPGEWQQVSIFLSPLDVHINRTPYGGEVTRIAYRPGRFLAAYDDRAAAENERNELWIRSGDRTVVFRQVVGRAGPARGLPRAGRRPTRGRGAVRPHEVRLAHGRLRAARVPAAGQAGRRRPSGRERHRPLAGGLRVISGP